MSGRPPGATSAERAPPACPQCGGRHVSPHPDAPPAGPAAASLFDCHDCRIVWAQVLPPPRRPTAPPPPIASADGGLPPDARPSRVPPARPPR